MLKEIINSKLVKLGFCQNYWITFHIYSAMIGVIIMGLLGLSNTQILGVSFLIMILWELVEFKYEIQNVMLKKNIKGIDWSLTNYKYKEKWIYDTVGDILGAFISVVIMIIFKMVII